LILNWTTIKLSPREKLKGGKEIVETQLPAVITAQKGLNEPRYASLKGIMAAKKKTIEEKAAAPYNNLTEIIKMKSLIQNSRGELSVPMLRQFRN